MGFEVAAGTVFPESKSSIANYEDNIAGQYSSPLSTAKVNYKFTSLLGSLHLIVGGHVVPLSHFNLGVEIGIGYEYLRHDSSYNVDFTSNNPSVLPPENFSRRVIYNNHQLSFFLRLSIGGRLKRKGS
jgi:hypothetical protein